MTPLVVDLIVISVAVLIAVTQLVRVVQTRRQVDLLDAISHTLERIAVEVGKRRP